MRRLIREVFENSTPLEIIEGVLEGIGFFATIGIIGILVYALA